MMIKCSRNDLEFSPSGSKGYHKQNAVRRTVFALILSNLSIYYVLGGSPFFEYFQIILPVENIYGGTIL